MISNPSPKQQITLNNMNNFKKSAYPTHAVGEAHPVEMQGVTNSSQAYVPSPTGERRKNLHSTMVVVVDIATMILEVGGMAICVKGMFNLFNRKKEVKDEQH